MVALLGQTKWGVPLDVSKLWSTKYLKVLVRET